MRIFKIIFRLDLATPNFDMCDRAGAALRILHTTAGEKFFSTVSETFQNRMVWGSNQAAEGKEFYHVQIDTVSVNLLYETAEGVLLDSLMSNDRVSKLFEVVGELVTRFELSKIARGGIRIWAMHEHESSQVVLANFVTKIDESVRRAVSTLDSEFSDVAIVFEGQRPDKTRYRISAGPYSSSEAGKYFQQIQSEISKIEGLNMIVDADFFVSNFALTTSPKKWATLLVRSACEVIEKLTPIMADAGNE
jgi:hypothetical protein